MTKEVTAVLKLKTSISTKGLIQYFTLSPKKYTLFYSLKDAIDHFIGIFFYATAFSSELSI